MKTSNCPSCGARVIFRSTASIMVVCEYCQSTLLRRAEDIENLGKMADLLDDASLIQLGTEGTYRGMNFTVIGRIQMQYQQGVWNEWYVLFDNQRGGWLSDANGDYTMTFVMENKTPLPDWNALKAGMTLKLNGDPFVVMDIENSQCVAGAGELPFKVGAGFAAPSVDLRFERQFASIDYSEATPLLFFGASVDFADLHFSRLRDPTQAGEGNIKLQALQCPNCAASITIHAAGIARVTCPSCFALLDAEHPQLKLLKKFAEKVKIEPVIPLGSEGKLYGIPYRVLGFLRRGGKSDGILYHWDEYLLHHPQHGFFWLVEYQGHWSFARPCKALPTFTLISSNVRYQDQLYQHFSKGNVAVSYVLGEFYWRVAVGEKAIVSDYVAPPYSLSEEKTKNEITWTHSEYLDAEIVKAAFGIAGNMPLQRGVAANQVWAGEAGYRQVCRWFGWITLLVIVVQLISVWQSDDRVALNSTFQFATGKSPVVTSPVFAIAGHTGNLHLMSGTNLDNDWAAISMELVNNDTGEVYEVNREVSYYHGYEDGYWSEGSTSDDALIANVPSGNYVLSLEVESQHPVTVQLEIRRNVSNWHNIWVIEFLLLLLPIIYWWRRATFEAQRWADSDHPKLSPSEMIASNVESDD